MDSNLTQHALDEALLKGYMLSSGRYWFSIALNTSTPDAAYSSLVKYGLLAPHPHGSDGQPIEKFGYWQWDYEITVDGFHRIRMLQDRKDYNR